jgi:hypothetical protein
LLRLLEFPEARMGESSPPRRIRVSWETRAAIVRLVKAPDEIVVDGFTIRLRELHADSMLAAASEDD